MNTTRRIDTVLVLALAALAGAGSFDRTLSANVHELAGHTVIVGHGKVTVLSPIGKRLEAGL